MAINRWDPRRDLLELQRRMKELFDDALSRSVGTDEQTPGAEWRPPVDLFEESQRFVLRADLPGVAPDDVQVRVEDGRLVLRGERRIDAAVASEAYLRVERPHGAFLTRIALPPSIDASAIQATHRNGVIEIVLPKRQESSPGSIEIRSE